MSYVICPRHCYCSCLQHQDSYVVPGCLHFPRDNILSYISILIVVSALFNIYITVFELNHELAVYLIPGIF